MNERRQNRLVTWVLSVAAALMLLTVPAALGQGITDAVRTKIEQLGDAESKEVAAYVAGNSKNLLSDDPQLLKKDRDSLLEPLLKTDTSVPFRIAYDRELMPHINEMVGSGKEMIVINGLILAGGLATEHALDAVLGKLGDKAPAVRYQAGSALIQTFQIIHDSQPAILKPAQERALSDLQQQMAAERDPQVLDVLIRAALKAAAIDNLQNEAVSTLSKGVVQNVKGMPNPGGMLEAGSLLRAADSGQFVMAQLAGRNQALRVATAKDAAEMGGVLIARVAHMVQHKDLALQSGDPLRLAYAQVVSASQKLIQFAGQSLQPGGEFQLRNNGGAGIILEQSLREGTTSGDASFVLNVQLLIGPGGMLSKPPFELSPDKFK